MQADLADTNEIVAPPRYAAVTLAAGLITPSKKGIECVVGRKEQQACWRFIC